MLEVLTASEGDNLLYIGEQKSYSEATTTYLDYFIENSKIVSSLL